MDEDLPEPSVHPVVKKTKSVGYSSRAAEMIAQGQERSERPTDVPEAPLRGSLEARRAERRAG